MIRYSQFYGPGTYFESQPPPPRIHIDDAARATVPLLDAGAGVAVIAEGESHIPERRELKRLTSATANRAEQQSEARCRA